MVRLKGAVILWFITTFTSCSQPNANQQISLLNIKDVSKVIIINRTPNRLLKDSITISKEDSYSELIKEINNLKRLTQDVNVKANEGYCEINVILKNHDILNFDIIYSRYDGVIIRNENNGLNYKNNKLDEIMILSLDK